MPEEPKQVTVELPEAVTKALADLQALQVQVAKLSAQKDSEGNPVLTPELKVLTTEMERVEGEVKKAQSEFLKELEARTQELEESKAELLKVRGQRRREQFIKRVQGLKSLPGAPADDFAEILDKIETALTPKQFEKLNTLLTSWNVVIEKSALFQELGRSEIGAFTGAEGRLMALAREKQAAEKITYEQAYTKVLTENPQLYREYRKEMEGK